MDPLKKAMKREKQRVDSLCYEGDPETGIPYICPCDGEIIHEEADGHTYFTCKNYEDNGLHIRIPWDVSVEQELEKVSCQLKACEKARRDQKFDLQLAFFKLKEDVLVLDKRISDIEREKKIKEDVEQLKVDVADLQRVL